MNDESQGFHSGFHPSRLPSCLRLLTFSQLSQWLSHTEPSLKTLLDSAGFTWLKGLSLFVDQTKLYIGPTSVRASSVCWCEWFFKYFLHASLIWSRVVFIVTLISKDATVVSWISSNTYTYVSEFYIANYSKWCFICSSYYSFYNKDNVRITYNFSLALYGSHSVCRGHLHLLFLLSSWCATPETTLCEWRVQTQQVESDYNKHFSLLLHTPPSLTPGFY